MKKVFIRGAIVAAFAAIAGYGIYVNQEKKIALSDTMMANVEALATDEYGDREDCVPEPAKSCDMFVSYPDGDWGIEMLMNHKKAPGWL